MADTKAPQSDGKKDDKVEDTQPSGLPRSVELIKYGALFLVSIIIVNLVAKVLIESGFWITDRAWDLMWPHIAPPESWQDKWGITMAVRVISTLSYMLTSVIFVLAEEDLLEGLKRAVHGGLPACLKIVAGVNIALVTVRAFMYLITPVISGEASDAAIAAGKVAAQKAMGGHMEL